MKRTWGWIGCVVWLLSVGSWSCSESSNKTAIDAVDASGATDADADVKGDVSVTDGGGVDAGSASRGSCEAVAGGTPSTPWFSDISAASGIRAGNVVVGSSVPIPINDHSRLGFVDLNGDGLDDIVTHSLYPNPKAGVPFEHLVYLNNGDGTFSDFSDASGLRSVQSGFFAFGDVDNDGDQDCFAGLDTPLAGETHVILLNDGKGQFKVLSGSGVESLPAIAGNAVFADFNGDAKLDLFVGMGHTSFKGANRLLWGKGDGTFEDASGALNDSSQQPTNGSVACDYDNDGDLDIIVSNYGVSVMSGHNRLYRNDGGTFKEVAEASGFAYLRAGNPWLVENGQLSGDEPSPTAAGYVGSNGFGLDCADVNGDGFMDVFATAISHPNAGIYTRKWSDGTNLFLGTPSSSGIVFKPTPGLPFNEGDVDGAAVDVNNDGRLDLSVSRDKKYEKNYTNDEQKAWFGLLVQQADGSFKSVGVNSGINDPEATAVASLTPCDSDSGCSVTGEVCLATRCRLPCKSDGDCTGGEVCHTQGFCKTLLRMKNAQNHAWADVDGDGDLDLLVGGRDTGGGRPNFLFRNDIGSAKPWLALHLVGDGVKVNRDAIGARVTITWEGGAGSLMRERKASRGMHNSMDSRWLHFGFGERGCAYQIKVTWPDGSENTLSPKLLQARQRHVVTYPDKISAWKAP